MFYYVLNIIDHICLKWYIALYIFNYFVYTLYIMRYLLLVSILLSAYLPAFSYDEQCLKRASLRFGVPELIIRAVIDTESSGNPIAINMEGKAYYHRSAEEAADFLHRYKGRSIDVGLMQVNSFWFRKFNIPQAFGLRECFNINFGTWILSYEIANHGLNLKAVGKYHSPDDTKGSEYSSKILRKMIDILKNS